jgi:hypothetical protein
MVFAGFGLFAESETPSVTSEEVAAPATELLAPEEGSAVVEEKKADFKEKLKKILGVGEDEPVEEVEKPFPLKMTVDFVSRYIWRGKDFGAAPNIQPGLSYSVGDKVSFTVGAWGSYTLGKNDYAELDLYSSLTAGPVSFGFTDYGFPLDGSGDGKYFTYSFDKGTTHYYEAFASFNGVDKFPMTLLFAEGVGGAIDNDGDGEKDYDNIYVELGYPVYKGINVFMGMGGGIYLTPVDGKDRNFNVVNVGLKASHTLNLGDKINMPVSGSLIFNPDARNVYFVATIGLSN